jgi:hypothetical protein|tara:strand:+ start:452 stop:676 length:225 start_codon:yes stop_codon:yes gene_type:complete
MMTEPKDISKKHFYVSLVKSIWRLVAGGLLAWGGYVLWVANDYSDIFIAECGFFLMLSGVAFILAEILGIVEEL